jgi:hypothetical protein
MRSGDRGREIQDAKAVKALRQNTLIVFRYGHPVTPAATDRGVA